MHHAIVSVSVASPVFMLLSWVVAATVLCTCIVLHLSVHLVYRFCLVLMLFSGDDCWWHVCNVGGIEIQNCQAKTESVICSCTLKYFYVFSSIRLPVIEGNQSHNSEIVCVLTLTWSWRVLFPAIEWSQNCSWKHWFLYNGAVFKKEGDFRVNF